MSTPEGFPGNRSGKGYDPCAGQRHSAKKRRTKEKKEWQDIQSGRQYYADRVNPQKALNKREAIAEERIIAFLYKDNGFSDYILDKISPDAFATDFNRRLFRIIAEKNTA